MSYRKINNLTGWFVFLFALIVYLLTVAPTASFWDCGEFIACSNELEVTHPPGAPLFLLLGRLFSMLAFNQTGEIAYMVNLMSVLSGAFTSMFICWITMAFAKKGLEDASLPEHTKIILLVLAGIVAGMSCTFADSIWWNAVEAEVYAMSSFFTAIVVWLMIMWSARADQPDHLKWIILIAYVMGLSLGVHLLNLLTIPALALIYYFRKYEFSWRGLFISLALSIFALLIIQYGILQYSFSIAWQFEKLFTGTISREGTNPTGLGMPKGTGSLLFAGLVIAIITGLLIYSHRTRSVALNTVVLCFTVILIGFSSYSVIFIRSNADPPIDMNNPEDLLSFLSYMRREQYGDRPLIYGPMYNGQVIDFKAGEMRYMTLDDKRRYVEDVEETEYIYRPGDKVLFPRMYETGRYRAGPFGYFNYVSDKGENLNDPRDDHPTRAEDFYFFLDYQLGHMYLRYFLWNFVGRASDIQNDSWESGLEPASVRMINRDNKAKNHYYFIPLFLGLLGLVWHSFHRKRDALVIGMLFIFTGVAIVVYLNQWPAQPRERDYSFAGSFQTFCIWIGMGVIFFAEWLYRYTKRYAAFISGAICLIGPLLMGIENWDDHTRKGRYIDREFAYNLLNTCEPNAILFTGGDNDTFPLWYIQEVEGVRTDVRVVNLELLISDWYIDQMKVPHNNAQPVPITVPRIDYMGEKGLVIRGFPSRTIEIPIDREALVEEGVLTKEQASWAADTMKWEFQARGSEENPYILRKDLIIMNILLNIAQDDWKRPVYFASMMDPASYVGLEDYFRLEGLAYRVVPVKASIDTPNDMYMGWVGQEIMSQHLTETFKYTGLDNPDVYFDEHIRTVIIGASYQNSFYRLAMSYARSIQKIEARNEVLRLASASPESPKDSLSRLIQENMQIIETANDRLDDETFNQLFIQLETASELLDTPEIRMEELEKNIEANTSLIQSYQQDIDDIISLMMERIPDKSIAYSYSDWALLTRIYQSAGMEAQLLGVISSISADALADISLAIRTGRQLQADEPALSAVFMSIQYLTRKGKLQEARQLADTLKQLTGDTRGEQLIQQELQ